MTTASNNKIINLAHPDSGCKLARTMSFEMFHGLCLRAKDICKDCAFNPCLRMKIIEDAKRQADKANFGKHSHETNAEIAKRLGVSNRQVSKMRKRGEL